MRLAIPPPFIFLRKFHVQLLSMQLGWSWLCQLKRMVDGHVSAAYLMSSREAEPVGTHLLPTTQIIPTGS